MKTNIQIALFAVLALLSVASASALSVTIEQPTQNSIHLQDDVLVKASVDSNSTLKYKLDSNNEIVVCNNCNKLETTLQNLANGQHSVKVTAVKENETNEKTVNFTVSVNNPVLDVVIAKPVANSVHYDDDIVLRASMNIAGVMKYKLDNNSEVVACSSCSYFEKVLTDLTNGQHTIKVTGTSSNLTDEATVTFKVNETAKPSYNETDGESKFSNQYNKLPQMFASGEITVSELKTILENNQLPPGVINRLAKTGKLTPELINVITKTQFLPAGIAGKVLGIFGFGKNKAVDNLLKNYNLTDEQLANLIVRSELPKGSTKKMIESRKLGVKSISALIKDEELSTSAIKKLIESQTLTSENIADLLENQKIDKKIASTLIEQQLLDADTIAQIKQYGNGDLEKKLEKFQNQERNNKEESDSDDDNKSKGKGNSDNSRKSIGKQKGKDKD